MNLFKSIVDESNAAILYIVPKVKSKSGARDFVINYANQCAHTLFSLNKDLIGSSTIAEVPKLSEVENLRTSIHDVATQKKQSTFSLDSKSHALWGTMHGELKPVDDGVLLTITGEPSKQLENAEASTEQQDPYSVSSEKEISDLFNNRVLNSFNNIICYLKPILNSDAVIQDFLFCYVNNRVDAIVGDKPESIIGKTLLEYYPQNKENGSLNILIDCYNTGKDEDYIRQYSINGRDYWFSNRVVKMNEGLILFSKDVSREKQYEEQLFVQNKLLTEAESVASIGSFRWNLAKSDIKFSDNVYRLFGYEPNEFEANYERLFGFVHANDVEKVKKGFKQAKEKKTRTDIVFRIITKLNEVKSVNTIGECFLKEYNWYMVGVIKDVTKQIEVESNLQAKNSELKRTNADLEAFNRVASHDLQEPLRKIQMFISRLSDEEKERMTVKSQGYLEKVKSSSDRMRNLINNLLSYAKVEEVTELPKSVNLNDVLYTVLEDLGERIKEINAEIKVEGLPIVNGVQFQLEQLFANLIGNSLKYIKPGTIPKIQIKSSSVSSSNVPKELGLTNNTYVKLQFIDNGIGFDRKYEKKIFEIFQRLHGKNEFTGSGLGLSICKKIVQSHHGAIIAKGRLNEGAKFIVYLPALW